MVLTDEEVKALEIIIPAAFTFLSGLVVTIGGVIIAKINTQIRGQHEIHKKINGLLAEKTLADTAKGKIEGIAQEKSDQAG